MKPARFCFISILILVIKSRLTVILLQVCVEVVGYLLEELRDGKNYEAFKADMQTANVFIGSLIFIEELADKVSHSKLNTKLHAILRKDHLPVHSIDTEIVF